MISRPEDRYVKLEVKTLSNGRVVYKPAIPVSVPTDDNDSTFVANERDRMDIIANNAYGTQFDWWRIAAANKHVNGSLHFKPGTKVVIPKGS